LQPASLVAILRPSIFSLTTWTCSENKAEDLHQTSIDPAPRKRAFS
jgi:hypothetical protein